MTLTNVVVAVFFLACVVVAGIFGALTASRKILWVQALPGAVALALVLLSRGQLGAFRACARCSRSGWWRRRTCW